MSLIEGGGVLKCFRHDFETRSIEKWNDHCDDGDHYDVGNTICNVCGRRIEFEIPFKRFSATGSKDISLTCDECNEKRMKNVKTRRIS